MNALNAIRRAVIAPVVTWYNRQRMFEELNGLSDRVLADIGLTRAQFRPSSSRPTGPSLRRRPFPRCRRCARKAMRQPPMTR